MRKSGNFRYEEAATALANYSGAIKLMRGGVPPLVCVGSVRKGVRGVALTTAKMTTMAKPKTVPSFVSMDMDHFPRSGDCRIAGATVASANAEYVNVATSVGPAEQVNLV